MYQKAEKEFIFLHRSNRSFRQLVDKLQAKAQQIFIKRGLLFIIIGFLLGRALILEQVSPFALPFFAAIFLMKKERLGIVALAVLFGALSISIAQAVYIFVAILVFTMLRPLLATFIKDNLKVIPIAVLFASLITRLLISAVTEQQIAAYDIMMSVVEAGLSLILTMIFIQGVPLLATKRRKQSLKNEEIICLIILLASILTGTIGWSIQSMSMEHILSRYLVLLFAFVGGAAIGSTVGVVLGLILSLANVASLYQMSLLAFSGLMGGLLKDGKKIGVGLGLIIGTLLIGLYGENSQTIFPTLAESMVAILLFLFTPKLLIENISKFIPGTEEYALEQQLYARKIRDVTASRVEQFSSLFQVLSQSFALQHHPEQQLEDDPKEIDLFLSNVTEHTCQTCFRKKKCWEQNFNTTYDYMKRIMHEIGENNLAQDRKLKKEWKEHCVKAEKVEEAVQRELSLYHVNQQLKKQVKESRRLVAEQLLGVSQVMRNFAKEIQKEKENLNYQEEQIIDALHSMGIEIDHIDIYSLKEGNVDIEISIPYCNGNGECEKVIAPMLSDILGETIVVKHEECAAYPNGNCHVSLGSAKTYVVQSGVSHVAKGGAWVSGDSYSTIELGMGKYAIAISDGMGNGERAHLESKETLTLLQKILQSGIEEKVAIKSINSVLTLRTTDEIFATLDLAIIDLQEATAKFLKIGSTPSFIKRGSQVIKVEAGNLPMGIIDDFEVDVVSEQLKAGDILIMMSDGVFEGPNHVENHEIWMKRKIRELQTDDPQEISDLLLEEVIRAGDGQILDDMTVVVAKIKHNTPEWATIPVYKYKRAQ